MESTFYLEQLLSCLCFSIEPLLSADGFSWSGLSVLSGHQRHEASQMRQRRAEQRGFHERSWRSNHGLRKHSRWAATTPPGSPPTVFIGQPSTFQVSPDIQAPWLKIKFLSPKYASQYVITCYHSSIISWRLSLFQFVYYFDKKFK